MTPVDLDALERLLAEATPGEWYLDDSKSQPVVRAPFVSNTSGTFRRVAAFGSSYSYDTPMRRIDSNNAALIVAAVNALPELIARIRELEQTAAERNP